MLALRRAYTPIIARSFLCSFLVIACSCATLTLSSKKNAVPEQQETEYDRLNRKYPQVATLQRFMDRASAYFYFGERGLAESAAIHLLVDIDELRSTFPDADLCDWLDYLEERAKSLLQRLAEDELERTRSESTMALLDSIARHTVVEEEIEIVLNEKTRQWISYFCGGGRKHFEKWLTRVGRYKGVIEPILVEKSLPRDLIYLAVIESGLNTSARSSMKAIGPWQFMSGTAQLFGLRVNWWIDERKDIVASSHAAANYLDYLYEIFGSWPLALAAYNAGEHRVAYAIARQGTLDYWRLKLPAQTQWFVPKFMAALEIGRNPEAYGFERPREEPLSFDIIEVDRPIELRAIAEAADCSLADLKELNPHFKRWCTPPDMIVEVKVPRGMGSLVEEKLAKARTHQPVAFVQHRVKRGETLSSIASQYEVTVKDLKLMNEMGSSSTIRAGNILLVPVKDLKRSTKIASAPSYRDKRPSPAYAPRIDLQNRFLKYIVKKNDSLVKIAEKFDAHLGDLRDWNGLSPGSRVSPGDTLIIKLGPERSSYDSNKKETASADETEESRRETSGSIESGKWIFYTVRKGDTLSSISRRYKVRLSDLLAWNNKKRTSTLHIGEKIRIRPQSDYAPPSSR